MNARFHHPVSPIARPADSSRPLRSWWRWLCSVGLEPTIRKSRDRSGHPTWHTHNPYTGKTSHLLSEAEVYEWIETLYR